MKMLKKLLNDVNIYVLISLLIVGIMVYMLHLNTVAIFKELEMISLTLGHFCNE